MELLNVLEAAHILGLPVDRARARLDDEGWLVGQHVTATVDQLEHLAMDTYPWHTHAHNDESYWLTSTQAAEMLGLSRARAKQLLDQDRLPYLVHRSGARLMRREQIEVLANARLSRDGTLFGPFGGG